MAGDSGDARLLGALQYDVKGRRHLNFDRGIKMLSEEELEDFPLEG